MKYRALAVGLVKDGHPVQNFGHARGPLEKWAREISQTEHVEVRIFIWEERLIDSIKPESLRPDQIQG